jgi:hypothetical protein
MTLPKALSPVPATLSPREREDARGRNENDYETTVNILGLPLAAHEVDWDAVRVTSADIGVLFDWLEKKGGTVSRLDTGFGVTVWTLSTNAGADEGYTGCRVLVTVPVPESGWVPCEVRDVAVAVAR